MPILFGSKFSFCLTYGFFGGNDYYCNFRHSVGRDCSVQLSVIAHSCRWRHLAAGGFPTPSRRCATSTISPDFRLLDCNLNSYILKESPVLSCYQHLNPILPIVVPKCLWFFGSALRPVSMLKDETANVDATSRIVLLNPDFFPLRL